MKKIIFFFTFSAVFFLTAFVFINLTACNKNPAGIVSTNYVYITNNTGSGSSIIDTDTTWSGTVELINNVKIKSNVNLKIEDDTKIIFNDGVIFFNYGNVTSGFNIRFIQSYISISYPYILNYNNFELNNITFDGDIGYIHNSGKNLFITNCKNLGLIIGKSKISNIIFKNCYNPISTIPGEDITGEINLYNCTSENLNLKLRKLTNQKISIYDCLIKNSYYNYPGLKLLSSTNTVINIRNTDFIHIKSNFAIKGIISNNNKINLSNCYIASNNGSTVICTSSNTPDDTATPPQYEGVYSISGMRNTPNF